MTDVATFTRFTKLAIHKILEQAHAYPWQLQGMGMFRLYLSREVRLHVWDMRFTVEKVSTLHTHPWNFTSYVLSGAITDRVYRVATLGPEPKDPTHYEQQIVCGPGGGVAGDKHPVCLESIGDTTWPAGSAYTRYAKEVHESLPKSGTVTLCHRRFLEDTEHANVYFRLDREWVSAEPRDAKPDEVAAMARMALDRWEP
jgi:hypothetical protein